MKERMTLGDSAHGVLVDTPPEKGFALTSRMDLEAIAHAARNVDRVWSLGSPADLGTALSQLRLALSVPANGEDHED